MGHSPLAQQLVGRQDHLRPEEGGRGEGGRPPPIRPLVKMLVGLATGQRAAGGAAGWAAGWVGRRWSGCCRAQEAAGAASEPATP
jgi:hypothetical protein